MSIRTDELFEKKEYMIIQGLAYYAKIVGDPHPAFDKNEREWSIDVTVDADTRVKLEAEGLGPKIRNKGDERGDFISFKRKAVKIDGTPAKPLEIKDHNKKLWDDRKIGNGSTVNVMFLINDTEYNKKKFRKPGILGVQVVSLVPYEEKEREEFPEYNDAGTEQWA